MISKEDIKHYIINNFSNVINVDVVNQIKPYIRGNNTFVICRISMNNRKPISIEINYYNILNYIKKKKLNKICKLIKN
jgi:hypothetical protein